MKKLMLMMLIMVSLTGCWFCDSDLDGVILNDSEVVYVVESGKINYYDKDGKLAKVTTLQSIDGWYVLSPGYLSKLIKKAQDDKLPKEPK